LKYLTTGTEYLKAHEGFRLVGQDDNLKLLSSVLVRSKAASVLLVGPGGVGATALCMGLQALKSDEHAPFDIVAKRLFWLNTDDLFSSGNPTDINSGWQKIMGVLARTPESILFIEDTKDFIEASRNSGCSHFINSLASAVKSGDTQVVLEARDDDVAFILKAHSDFKECFTMIELGEPAGDTLALIAHAAAENLSRHHGIRIDEDAIGRA
jgi:ATP-dependent Clp protease ATP-binding subunit ClpB